MTDRLVEWCEVNSGSNHLEGLERMLKILEEAFADLPGVGESISLPPMREFQPSGETILRPVGKAYRRRCRPEAPLQILLCGHMDTVFGREHPFQHAKLENGILNGPGAADMKGGLLVMLYALLAFEKSQRSNLGWEVLIVPDEEIGSQSSGGLLIEAAVNNQAGLVFEPSLPDGSMVRSRKGLGTFNVVVRGRAAHVGRNFQKGRNAIVVLSELIQRIDVLNTEIPEAVFNAGRILGGGALNVVPDRAAAQFNVRVAHAGMITEVTARLEEIVAAMNVREGISITLEGGFTRPPKIVGPADEAIFHQIRALAAEDGEFLQWKDSGGGSDGNNLSAAGLPNIDTLGPRGGNLHSDMEFVDTSSLPRRVRLVERLLLEWAANGLPPEVRRAAESKTINHERRSFQ
ncbi:MAG TPA: hydrolase [Chthoniobacterales bacterium]